MSVLGKHEEDRGRKGDWAKGKQGRDERLLTTEEIALIRAISNPNVVTCTAGNNIQELELDFDE